jgi:hypothetical protein
MDQSKEDRSKDNQKISSRGGEGSGKLCSNSGQSSATAKLGFIAPVHFTLPWLCEN